MPLFFIISGFLSRDESFGSTIKKAFKSLLVPYFFFNAVLLCFTLLLEYKSGHLSFQTIWSHIIPIFIGLGYKTANYNPVCTTMWFFYVLFLIKTFSALVGTNHLKRIAISIVSIILVYVLNRKGINTDFPIDSFLMAFPLYVWGGFLRQISKRLSCEKYKQYSFSLLVLPIMFLCSIRNGRVDIDVFKYGNSLCLFYLNSITICSILIISVLPIIGGAKL